MPRGLALCRPVGPAAVPVFTDTRSRGVVATTVGGKVTAGGRREFNLGVAANGLHQFISSQALQGASPLAAAFQ